MSAFSKICLLGFGEVGNILAEDLLLTDTTKLIAFDIKFDDLDYKSLMSTRSTARINLADSVADAMRGCDLVISAVTAAQDLRAAQAVAEHIESGTLFVDLNSVSPATKIKVARTIEAAGGCYIEAAIMSPIAQKRIAAPILLGGPHAQSFLQMGITLGFTGARFFSGETGKAAASKMCRSIIIKGVEALLAESLLAARHYGVEDEVLASLNDLFPRPDWPQHARYMISRSIEHGVRRGEEMQEAAATVSDCGVAPYMSEACIHRQEWASHHTDALVHDDLSPMLDAISLATKSGHN